MIFFQMLGPHFAFRTGAPNSNKIIQFPVLENSATYDRVRLSQRTPGCGGLALERLVELLGHGDEETVGAVPREQRD